MLREYNKFWTQNRINKAKKLRIIKRSSDNFSINSTKRNCIKKLNDPMVAGLYLNRLKKGWPLQADPTVIYSIKEQKGQIFCS